MSFTAHVVLIDTTTNQIRIPSIPTKHGPLAIGQRILIIPEAGAVDPEPDLSPPTADIRRWAIEQAVHLLTPRYDDYVDHSLTHLADALIAYVLGKDPR